MSRLSVIAHVSDTNHGEKTQRFQDVVQAQPLPEFQTHVDVTGGPGCFVGHAVDVYRNQIAGRGGRGSVDIHGGSGLRGEHALELLEFRVKIGHSREGQLTGEGVLEFSGQREPLFGRSGREITERTDYLLSWSLVGEDGLDQKEVHIGFIFVSTDCLADVHGHYRCQNIQRKSSRETMELVTILEISLAVSLVSVIILIQGA